MGETVYSEGGTRCGECGEIHVIFRESRPSNGIAMAKDVTPFYCSQCKALLFEEDVADNEHVMVLRASSPQVEEIRQWRAQNQPTRGTKAVELMRTTFWADWSARLLLVVVSSMVFGPYLAYLTGLIRKGPLIQATFIQLGVAATGGLVWLSVRKHWDSNWVAFVGVIIMAAFATAGFFLAY